MRRPRSSFGLLLTLSALTFATLTSPVSALAQPADDRITPHPSPIRTPENLDAVRRLLIRQVQSALNVPEAALRMDTRGGADTLGKAMKERLPRGVIEASRALAEKRLNKPVSDEQAIRFVFAPQGDRSAEAAVILNAVLRPCLLVCNDDIDEPVAPPWTADAELSKAQLETTLRSTGAISFNEGSGDSQVGSGFVIAPGIVVTNRHVALIFSGPGSRQSGQGRWQLRSRFDGQGRIEAAIDFGKFDPSCTAGSRSFRITQVLHIEEEPGPDVALLQVEATNSEGQPLPPPLPFVTPEDKPRYLQILDGLQETGSMPANGRPDGRGESVEFDVYVAGYPRKFNYNFTSQEEKIFHNIFDVKRLSLGSLKSGSRLDADLLHDCQTLGGSSGSPVCELATGKVIGLHREGEFRVANYAVPLWAILERPAIQRLLGMAENGSIVRSGPGTSGEPGGKVGSGESLGDLGGRGSGEAVQSAGPKPRRGGAESAPGRGDTSPGGEAATSSPPRMRAGATEAAVGARAEAASVSVPMVAFDEDGAMIDPIGFESLLPPRDTPPSDVFILSHGWNNSPAEAAASYERIVGHVRDVSGTSRPAGYQQLLLGIRWPSKAWIPEDGSQEAAVAENALEAGPGSPAGRSIDPRIVAALYENLPRSKAVPAQYSRDILRIQDLLVKLDPKPEDFKEILVLFRRYALGPDFPEDLNAFNSDRGMEAAVSKPIRGGKLEGAFSPLDIARVFTYYQMKARAGLVGRNGVRAMIARVQNQYPAARIHLFGHSFGCKVMLAAVGERDLGPPRPVTTLVLIQGAVSLEAMADRVTGTDRPGGYRSALLPTRVTGPIIVTFSARDRALNQAYPIASRLAGQTGELEAGQTSKYSALGAVGAFGANSDLQIMHVNGQAYTFASKVVSVDGGASSDFIGGHSEIYNSNVAWLLWSAVKLSFPQ